MADKMQIRMLRGVVGGDFVYSAGGIYEAPADRALDLINAGHAVKVDTGSAAKPEKANSKQADKSEKR